MKNLTLILICLALLFGCKEAPSKSTSEDNKTTIKSKKNGYTKNVDFDCYDFFSKGDYSSICFIDTKLPRHINRACIFDFVTKGDKQEQSLKVQIAGKNSAALAEMSFNLNKNNYKKGIVTDVTNLGDAAFFDVHVTDLKSLSRSNKDLHVLYNNITFTLFAEYLSKSEKPCFYSDQELIAFAELIIQNL